jgi:hypothetical protein
MRPSVGFDHAYRLPGSNQSMIGTLVENSASDQSSPFVRNSRNCTYQAPAATKAAKRMRPLREFGVVLGSEIIKNANSSNAPFSRR